MSSEQEKIAETSLAEILNESSGFDMSELDHNASFLELGFDSLFLIQFSQRIKNKLKVKVTFRQLIEEIPTIGALVKHVAKNVSVGETPQASQNSVSASKPDSGKAIPSSGESASSVVTAETKVVAAPPAVSATSQAMVAPAVAQAPVLPAPPIQSPQPVAAPVPSVSQPPLIPNMSSAPAGLAEVIAQQNQLMSMQLQLLTGSAMAPPAQPPVETVASPAAQVPSASHTSEHAEAIAGDEANTPPVPQTSPPPSTGSPASDATSPVIEPKREFSRFGPYKPVRRASDGGLTEQQQNSLDAFMERFTKRTSKSREHAQRHRPHFADPRGVAGYRRIWKSIVYQIAVERSKGCQLWDIDGNEYIDIAMGFGLNLFGQSPDFITKSIHEQLDRGVEVGPQSPLAGDVAQLLCDFSRQDRVTFCNTGSEAVMAAMRLARTVTGKSKIVFFNKDYHGNFDQVLIRSNRFAGKRVSQPAAPGVPQPFADIAIVLDYGTDEALQTIRERADEIAAVLIEPVQSADPFTQPKEFLQEIRQITQEQDIAMIMDEVITGFRAAPGGAQEWFDVWADMATYGKVLGGGLPIGALAGSNKYMDALDGGDWRYEDDTEPEADMTFFAGTFVRHPLAMTAAHEVLMKVKEEGPELQKGLTRRTTRLVDALNAFFEEEVFPFRVAQFASLFRFMFPPTLEYADLLYFHLLDRGIFTRGWGDNCFLSTAHTDSDVDRIIEAVKDSCLEIRRGGFMPKPDDEPDASDEPTAHLNQPESAHETTQTRLADAPAHVSKASGEGDAINSGQLETASTATIAPTAFRVSTVEEIQEEGTRPPLFCASAADGLTMVYHELSDLLGEQQPVYGLNSPGLLGEDVPATIEEMATRFIEDMREVQPHGPYHLIGYCSGGTVAYEMAQQLTAAGEEVALLAGIETYNWAKPPKNRYSRMGRLYHQYQRVEFHIRNFILLDRPRKLEFLRSKMDRAKLRLANIRGMLSGLFSRSAKRPESINMHEIWKKHDHIADIYVPHPYPGNMLIIRPLRDYWSYTASEDLECQGGLDVVRIPGYPAGLMSAPFVQRVAEMLEERIDGAIDPASQAAMTVSYDQHATRNPKVG